MMNTNTMMSIRSFLIALALASLAASLAAIAQSTRAALALVSDLEGSARLVSGGAVSNAKMLSDLFADTRIELDRGARVVLLVLASGEEATLRGPATAVMATDGLISTPAEALTRKKSAVGDTQLRRRDLAQAAIVMRKPDQTVRPPLLSLAGTFTLEAAPVFRWSAVQDAGPYRFSLYDESGRTLHETVTTDTRVALPAAIALEQNRRYTWEVSTRRANGLEHLNFGDFALAPPGLREEAGRRRPPADATFAQRVTYAVWLDSRDLFDDSRGVWQRLASERPGDENLRRMAEQ